MSSIKKYLSLVKFSHTIFAMPFALIGFFLGTTSYGYWESFSQNSYQWFAGNIPDFSNYPKSYQEFIVRFILVILCMVFARSAAMAFNRYLDRSFDAKNPRTAIREIPAGIISSESALRFVIINCLLFIATTFFINRLCFFLSPVALFVILFYSYTKRFTPLCHLVLGVGLSLAPIGAYLAVTGVFALLPILFSLAVIFWVSGFDIIYALQDVEFDRSQQLFSMPALAGQNKSFAGIGIVARTFCSRCGSSGHLRAFRLCLLDRYCSIYRDAFLPAFHCKTQRPQQSEHRFYDGQRHRVCSVCRICVAGYFF